ncbi:MAG TPA: UDP-N-acetylmuramate dehydrogenase [Bacillota bacterium]|nr:UDP-N-acetylmuramate dehydrogenase [Bacillota bacterium]
MDIRQNVSLKDYSTMRLGGIGAYAIDVHDRYEVTQAVDWAQQRNLPVLMIGIGSNVVWRDEGFPGLILVNKIKRIEEQQEDEENYYITVGSGETWDEIVALTAAKGMTGIEALSLIPGTAGATPIQNVGAYYQDVGQVMVSVEAYDIQEKKVINIPKIDCNFAYRTSRFKTTDKGRFLITAITLHLLHKNPQPPFYPSLQAYFDEHQIHEYTPQVVRDAIIAIRRAKLPDPAKVANNGSFFANPFVSEGELAQLQADYGSVPHWPTDDGRTKIPAAWLIENAGFKDFHDPETGMGTWPTQPLVLVNEHATSTNQLLAFQQKITDAIHLKFGITLEQEPVILP